MRTPHPTPEALAAFRQADVPVDVGRDEARDAARRELADPVYQAHEPNLFEHLWNELIDLLGELFDALASLQPGGMSGLIVLALLAAVVVALVRWRVGPLTKTRRADRPLLGTQARTAADHREAAETAFDQGDLAEAVTERFRAIVRELDQRGVLDEPAGSTADEIAAQSGGLLPGSATGLRDAARIFDDVFYGGLPATRESYRLLSTVDDSVRSERPVLPAVTR